MAECRILLRLYLEYMEKADTLSALGKFLHRESFPSSFYGRFYAKKKYVPLLSYDEKALQTIPRLTWNDIAETPLKDRLYATGENILTKIISRESRGALWAQKREEVEKEPYGMGCKRPLLLFRHSHECTEKGLWFYGKNILPLAKEPNLDITILAAKKYEIDGIVGETSEIATLVPHLQKVYPLERIRFISVLDERFEPSLLRNIFPNAIVEYRLALPETGVIAVGKETPARDLEFSPLPHVLIQIEEGELIATKLRDTFPLIR
jgi:hypothetical protein